MTDKEKEIIEGKIKVILPNLECPMCHNKRFTILDRYIVSSVQDDYRVSKGVMHNSIPALALVCTRCGFISQHSLGVLGLFEKSGEEFNIVGITFNMIRVEGGTFYMGVKKGDLDASDNELPLHKVTLSSYSIGETTVTQALWEAVLGNNPSHFKGASRPVENVSWNDCQVFIRKLNMKTNRKFRLPTEAEWEFAARGAKQSKSFSYAGSNNIDDVAWYESNSNNRTHSVAKKLPNELGLYDMNGNVFEFCQDPFIIGNKYGDDNQKINTENKVVIRGGSWCNGAVFCRSTYRYFVDTNERINNLGLRLAL